MNPRIAALTIGNELLDGDIADSNTQRMAEIISRQGFLLHQRISVGDDPRAIGEALLYLGNLNDVVIVSGGLGPTRDDLTAEAAAQAFQLPLKKNQEALEVVRRFFKKLGREITLRQEKQAMVPNDATILKNDRGSAPGFFLRHQNCLFAFMPGVPQEMEFMLQHSVLPLLNENFPEAVPWHQKTFKLLGLPESNAESILDSLNLSDLFQIGICVKFPFVNIRLSLRDRKGPELLAQAGTKIRARFAEQLVAEDDETLVGNVAELLIRSGQTLSLAESCTGGWIAKMLTDIPGSSAFLERGAVTYSNRAKNNWLQVSEDIFNGPGAVSEECALAMVRGIRKASGSDLALAVTGIAGPDGGTPQKPVGTVFIALADARKEKVFPFLFPGDREKVRFRSACTALNLLRCHFLKYP